MNGPSGFDPSSPAPLSPKDLAAPAHRAAASGSDPKEENPLSFEEVLDEETSNPEEFPPQKLKKDQEPERTAAAFPFFAPAGFFLLQNLRVGEPTMGVSISASGAPSENKLPAEVQAVGGKSEQIAGKPLQNPIHPGGIPAAKQDAMVFTTSSDQESAGTERKLPTGAEYLEPVEPERGMNRPSAEPRQAQPSSESALHDSAAFSHAASARVEASAPPDELTPVEGPHPAVSKTIGEIGGHVQLLRAITQDRLEVVLHPDPGTQLYLDITKTDGMIQIRARCDKGDFVQLDAHWGAIQSSLAAQGIRVEPLQPSVAFNEHPDSGRQGSPDRHPEQRPAQEFVFEQDPPAKMPARPASRPLWPSRGWQRWA